MSILVIRVSYMILMLQSTLTLLLIFLANLSVCQTASKTGRYPFDETNDSAAEFARGLADAPDAFLSLNVTKKSIYVGECTTLTLAFHVSESNTVAMQFYELGSQLANIISTRLELDNCWIINDNIDNIQGIPDRIQGSNYVTYPIYRAAYCPVNAGLLTIPSTKLIIAKVKPISKVDSLLEFFSDPLSIKVDALPSTTNSVKFNPIVGSFELSDSLHSNTVSVGQAVNYSVTMQGKGLAYPMHPPKIRMENVDAYLVDIIDVDTLLENQVNSTKTFVYRLIFQQPGSYELSGSVSFDTFNPSNKKTVKHTSTRKVEVTEGINKKTATASGTFGSINNFIAIDISQSMSIKDYRPNRLEAVKAALKKFLMSRDTCDIGLILFGGNAKHFTMTIPGKCYTPHFIDSLDFRLADRGTAIGDAIWLANISFPETSVAKKLIVIGDGDNTAGHLSPKFAASMAKKHKVQINAIGVGSSGPVPYGLDEYGKDNMIENTFTDKDFKTIATMTGGKYYWAKDSDEVEKVLRTIFPGD